MYKNTTQRVGDVVEITSSMKLAFNGRPVTVAVSKSDRDLLDSVSEMYNCGFVTFKTPADSPLEVQITSDTFRGGLTGKLVNLKEWHDARQAAYSQAWVEYNC
jgi:hypothetical protein